MCGRLVVTGSVSYSVILSLLVLIILIVTALVSLVYVIFCIIFHSQCRIFILLICCILLHHIFLAD